MDFDFSNFMAFTTEHNQETIEYITKAIRHSFFDERLNLSEADIALISKISLHSAYAVFRLYFEWLHSQPGDLQQSH